MTGPAQQAPDGVDQVLLDCQRLQQLATTDLVRAGLYLLSIRAELQDPVQWQAQLQRMHLDAQEANGLMLVAAFIARAPEPRRDELMATDFDSLLSAARFVDQATLGAVSGRLS